MSSFEVYNNFIKLPSKDKGHDVYINLTELYDYIEVYGLLPSCKHYDVAEFAVKQWYKSKANYLHIRKLDCNILPYLSNNIVELLIHNINLWWSSSYEGHFTIERFAKGEHRIHLYYVGTNVSWCDMDNQHMHKIADSFELVSWIADLLLNFRLDQKDREYELQGTTESELYKNIVNKDKHRIKNWIKANAYHYIVPDNLDDLDFQDIENWRNFIEPCYKKD